MLSATDSTRNARGFTLIELVVVVAVLGIALSLGASSYQTWIASTRVRNGAESLLAGMQLARGEAIARNAQVAFRQDDPAKPGWCVTLDPASCSSPLRQGSATDGSSTSVTVSYANGASQKLVFDGFGRLVSPTPTDATKPLAFNVTHPTVSDARKLRVTVDIGGTARMCDPNVTSSTDPRKCPS